MSTFANDTSSVEFSTFGIFNKVLDIRALSADLLLNHAVQFPRLALNLETAPPRYRAVFGALWIWDTATVSLKESLYGPSSNFASRTGCPPVSPPIATCYRNKIKRALITDLEVGFAVTDRIKAVVGANNLFNTYPDRVNAFLRNDYFRANSNACVTQYPTFSPFGINGGYYYSKLSLTF